MRGGKEYNDCYIVAVITVYLGATALILAKKLAVLPTIAFAPSVHMPTQRKSIITITK